MEAEVVTFVTHCTNLTKPEYSTKNTARITPKSEYRVKKMNEKNKIKIKIKLFSIF